MFSNLLCFPICHCDLHFKATVVVPVENYHPLPIHHACVQEWHTMFSVWRDCKVMCADDMNSVVVTMEKKESVYHLTFVTLSFVGVVVAF